MDLSDRPDQWTQEDVMTILTNPICLGLGTIPAVVDIDTFAKAGGQLLKEIGAHEYLGRVYDNLLACEEFTGRVPAMGSREDFVSKHAVKLRNATSRAQGIKNLVERIRSQLAPS